MNAESSEVETNLASIGIRCNTSLIGKKSVNLTDINRESTGKSEKDRALAGQLVLLHRCTTVTGRLLRKHDSPLLASKLIVVSRFLYKTLSQTPNAPPFLETLRSQLSSVQKLIRRRINRILGSANSSIEDIIDSMAAYCVSNSASSLDVITHFHTTRLNCIGKHSENASEYIPKALSLYVQTLQNTKALFSRRLSEALGKLQAQPLLNDSDIRNLEDLDLDILGRWVVTDVKNFTPWIKSDDLTKQTAEQILKSWSRKAFNNFLERSESSLKNANDFAEVLSLRKRTIDIWLSAVPITPTHSSVSILEGLRDVFNSQLKLILLGQAQRLLSVGDAVKSHIEKWTQAEDGLTQSLWDANLTSLEISEGAAVFKRVLTETLLGQDSRIANVLELYTLWLTTIEDSRHSIDGLRHTKWEDTFDDDEDDEEFQTSSVDLLNQDDPHQLREAQRNTIEQAFLDLQKSLSDAIGVFGDSENRQKAAFVLRLIRDLRRDSPSDVLQDDGLSFAQDIVPSLHKTLAEEVLARVPASKILPPSKGSALSRVPGRTLWEKTPEIPIQPLPSTFNYFKRLVEAMEDLGPDLWNPSAVGLLKKTAHKSAVDSLSAKLEKLKQFAEQTEDTKEQAEEGSSTEKDDSKMSGLVRDWKIQLLLDAFYIRDALSIPSDETDSLDKFIETLQGEIEEEDGTVGTLQEAAHEFWKRTELLFGLLAN
jgi:conserved oligomeric Golgi complex subunit 1